MSPKSFLFTLAIFSGGYVSNTLLDEVVDRTESYFHVDKSTYKKGLQRLHYLQHGKAENDQRGPAQIKTDKELQKTLSGE